MTQRRFQQLSAVIALAIALLVPARAWAALLPACENRDAATWIPRDNVVDAVVALEEGACTERNAWNEGDEVGDSKVPALCDPRGASVIAPPRIHNIIDARIESGVPCGSTITTPMIGPGPDDGSSLVPLVGMPSHAVVPEASLLPPPSFTLAPDFPPREGGARSGIARDVYHPPR